MRKFEIILALCILIGALNLVFGDGWLGFIFMGVGIMLIGRHRAGDTRKVIAMPDAFGQRLPRLPKRTFAT